MQTSLIGQELMDQICFGISSLGELWIRPAVYGAVGRGSFPLASKSVSFILDWPRTKYEQRVEWNPALQPHNTVTLLLQPLVLATRAKSSIHFFVKKPLLVQPMFFGPLVTVKMGFHCMNFQPATLEMYSEIVLYGHPLNTDTSLLWIVCYPWGKKAHTFSLNSTLLIWTPH